MSITDPVLLVYDEKRQAWRLQRGRETFYDHKRELLTWNTAEEAREWCKHELGVVPIDA